MTRRAARRTAAALADAPFTYPNVGGTLSGEAPPDFHQIFHKVRYGNTTAAFERLREGLMSWEVHRRSGIKPLAAKATATEGDVTVMRAWHMPIVLLCRVHATIDEPDRVGFVYGTLPGHPEEGEESFMVVRAPDGGVDFYIEAFSRPASWAARNAGRLGSALQIYATRRYLTAARLIAWGEGSTRRSA